MTQQFTNTIDGEDVAVRTTAPVVNPALGTPFASAPLGDLTDLDRAVEAAGRAYRTWRTDAELRRRALRAASEAFRGARKELAATLVQEQGKPFAQAIGEIVFSADILGYYADLDPEVEVLLDDERTRVELRRRPLGVVGAITPWNYPIMLAVQKIAPALAAGNTVVLKPSPYTPLSTLQFGTLLRDVLPPGVLNVISGGDDLGAALVAHPKVVKVSFTGSVATGRRVATSASYDLKRTTLELGGNDAAILLADVDVAKIATRLFWSAFLNSGQVCSAVKRVYAPRSRYDDVVDALSDVAAGMTLGNGMDRDTDLGPLNNATQRDIVEGMVAEAVRGGARVATGGARPDGDGYFFAPTIIADVAESSRIVAEEQFGPALPIVAYDDVDDAVDRANATHFGLGASVWGADGDRAAEVASRMEAGVVWVNTHLELAEWQPFGGSKWSGNGMENGLEGYRSYTDAQVIRRSRR